MKKIFLCAVTFFVFSQNVFAIQELVNTYSEDNKFGLIQGQSKVTDAIYNKLIRLGDSSWLFLDKTKYGIIDNSGQVLVEPKYTTAQRYVGKYAKLGYGGKYAIYDEFGNLIIDREYTSIDILYGRMFLVRKNYKYGLISFDGDILLAPVADDIYMPKPNVIKIQYDGTWYEIAQPKREVIEIPNEILSAGEMNDNFTITQIIENPITSAGYGVVSLGDYMIKIFSSISPAYEQTIDELILAHGADTASILIKSSWLLKFPFVYGKNYINNLKTPNNGPFADVKSNLKSKLK